MKEQVAIDRHTSSRKPASDFRSIGNFHPSFLLENMGNMTHFGAGFQQMIPLYPVGRYSKIFTFYSLCIGPCRNRSTVRPKSSLWQGSRRVSTSLMFLLATVFLSVSSNTQDRSNLIEKFYVCQTW